MMTATMILKTVLLTAVWADTGPLIFRRLLRHDGGGQEASRSGKVEFQQENLQVVELYRRESANGISVYQQQSPITPVYIVTCERTAFTWGGEGFYCNFLQFYNHTSPHYLILLHICDRREIYKCVCLYRDLR